MIAAAGVSTLHDLHERDEVAWYLDAAQVASSETGLPPMTFPATCPVTLDELLAE